jgi:AraC-like DNA-binding protein
MSNAAELVKSSPMPVKTIAVHCGYTDLSNFYRDFKQVHAITPMQMRLLQIVSPSQAGYNMHSEPVSEIQD